MGEPRVDPLLKMFLEKKSASSLYMDEIVPGLWLGSQEAADDLATLDRVGVKHIITVRECGHRRRVYPDRIRHTFYELDDEWYAPIGLLFRQTSRIIATARERKEPILVHCHAGISRSATLVAAYLLDVGVRSAGDALEVICTARVVSPNDGFRAQLMVYSISVRQFLFLGLLLVLALLVTWSSSS